MASASLTPLPIPSHPSWELVHHCSSLGQGRGASSVGICSSCLYPRNNCVPPPDWGNHLVFVMGITMCNHQIEEPILSLSWELLCVTARWWEQPHFVFILGITTCHHQAEGAILSLSLEYPCVSPPGWGSIHVFSLSLELPGATTRLWEPSCLYPRNYCMPPSREGTAMSCLYPRNYPVSLPGWRNHLVFIPGITACHHQAMETSTSDLYPRNYCVPPPGWRNIHALSLSQELPHVTEGTTLPLSHQPCWTGFRCWAPPYKLPCLFYTFIINIVAVVVSCAFAVCFH